MTFETISRLAFALTLVLGLTLIFVPSLYLMLFQIPVEPAALTIGRRAGVLFLGLATLTFMTKDSETSEVRLVVSATAVVVMGAFILLGLIEFVRGTVGLGIWLAIAVELFFGYYYLLFLRD